MSGVRLVANKCLADTVWISRISHYIILQLPNSRVEDLVHSGLRYLHWILRDYSTDPFWLNGFLESGPR